MNYLFVFSSVPYSVLRSTRWRVCMHETLRGNNLSMYVFFCAHNLFAGAWWQSTAFCKSDVEHCEKRAHLKEKAKMNDLQSVMPNTRLKKFPARCAPIEDGITNERQNLRRLLIIYVFGGSSAQSSIPIGAHVVERNESVSKVRKMCALQNVHTHASRFAYNSQCSVVHCLV